ncbi:thiol-specific monooxygenase [Trichoderma arundinaceum]|uniref:Thiol-specific monooxygenase n=1 Tax=Trichoderma arundinaceum TaxID=490622 RepID=A0A395NUA7_TRIAR|nr:thiol-specific monooxygenase [Trichoderma arundinaceum]
MGGGNKIKSVAVIGAGAAGAVTAAALKAEEAFDVIRVFERRECAGGTWIYDAAVQPHLLARPGALPAELDPPLEIPQNLPAVARPNKQERFSTTPIYSSLTTNVPEIAMSFSDARFPYGPFAPHHIPRQYIENYFALHNTDSFLVLSTTVEDVSKINHPSNDGSTQWKLTLRKYDALQDVDIWWEEIFDAVILANGHYSVPTIPYVKGLEDYTKKYPGRVVHSKTYRSPILYKSKRVLVIGNSASGTDLSRELISTAQLPVYQSKRSKTWWEGDEPPAGIEWKPVIKEYLSDGRILFEDGTYLDDIDTVIYCTGYKPSYPFWNIEKNGQPLWDDRKGKLVKSYWHTFFQDFPNLGIVGLPRVLTFRSFEYQAIALARLFANRNPVPLPSLLEQQAWEDRREEIRRQEHRKFHDITWEDGETHEWLQGFLKWSGLGTLTGQGRIPPPLTKEMVWAIENLKKYRPGGDDGKKGSNGKSAGLNEWIVVESRKRDVLGFI